MTRFFLVGCPRSGTTILQSILSSHPKIHSFPETHFFYQLRPKNKLAFKLGLASKNISKVLQRIQEENGCKSWKDPINHLFPTYKSFIDSFTTLLDEITKNHQKTHWIEKTPMHLHHIDMISSKVLDSKFIHIVRNGEDTISSLSKVHEAGAWGNGYKLEKLISRWKKDIGISTLYKNHPSHHVVSYDQLIVSPEKVIAPLAKFMDVDNSFSLRGNSNGLINKEEFWKKNVVSGLSSNLKSNSHFSKDQLEFVRKSVSHIDLTFALK